MNDFRMGGTEGQETDRHALAALHTRIVDALAGFDTMVEKAEPEFRPVVTRFADLHRRHAAAVAAMLEGAAGTEGGASFMSGVNRTVVTLRSWFDDIDDDVMAQVRNGEGHVLSSFDEAIVASSGARRSELEHLRGELEVLLEETAPRA